MKKWCFLILYFLVLIPISGQSLPKIENDTIIVWSESRKLNWNDFQIAEFEGTKAATSDIGIDVLTVSNQVGGYTHEVFSYFLKLSSSTETDDEGVLKHEQLHFDIAELFARKIRHKMNQLKSKNYTIKEYNSVINAIYEDYFVFQNRYDEETQHSMNFEMQKKWEKDVTLELKKLNHAKSKKYTN